MVGGATVLQEARRMTCYENLVQNEEVVQGRFLPPDYEQYLFQQYQRCRQGQKTVHEHTSEFLRLAERNNLMEIEGQLVSRYLEGLKPVVQKELGV